MSASGRSSGQRTGALSATEVQERLARRDGSLWPEGNVADHRLGWLDVAQRMESEAAELRRWADSIDAGHVVLLGMGGSSLGPLVLAEAARRGVPGSNGRRLTVCDTTEPHTVSSLQTDDTFFIVSSKSGTTLEPNALFAYAWSKRRSGGSFAAITDPGTPLARMAAERQFRRVFANPPDIGGRYSVLSYFGMVPAALLGFDPELMARSALEIDRLEAVSFGLDMAAAASEGRNKVTVPTPALLAPFGKWIEQLIAESTGKHGIGCVPVPTTDAEDGPDRFLAPLGQALEPAIRTGSPDSVTAGSFAAEFFRWELATAAAGHGLGIDPFDEPNVAESKANTAKVLDNLPLQSLPTEGVDRMWEWLTETVNTGDYVSLQAYLPFGQDDAMEQARKSVRDRLGGVATTAGYGPRFLHSTGQLHKGGPSSVVAVQIVPTDGWGELPIPGYEYGFGTLIEAQAIGDFQSLQTHGRRVLHVAAEDMGSLIA
ncbi:MAG: glucose-6-phosphate isomerase [Actinomycetota bacterium]|nr:glucose-6-phosphate isomerase [Actinomycetota bacterium]